MGLYTLDYRMIFSMDIFGYIGFPISEKERKLLLNGLKIAKIISLLDLVEPVLN